jgi:hypothetical protein
VKNISQAASHAGGLVFLRKACQQRIFVANYRLWENNQRLDFQLEHLLKPAGLAHKTRNSVIVSGQVS